jgi:hypothetical protein
MIKRTFKFLLVFMWVILILDVFLCFYGYVSSWHKEWVEQYYILILSVPVMLIIIGKHAIVVLFHKIVDWIHAGPKDKNS